MATLSCIDTIREFPKKISCIRVDRPYTAIQKTSRKYQGDVSVKELVVIDITAFIDNNSDMQLFAHWWYSELINGSLDFTIELMVFGTQHTFTVKMLNDLTDGFQSGVIHDIDMRLEIQDDITTILEQAISDGFCSVCN